MFELTVDASELLSLLSDTEAAERGIGTALRLAGTFARDEVKDRIQNHGANSDGVMMETRSAARVGAYSAGYAKHRNALGKQVGRVDLTVTGELTGSFQVIDSQPNSATVGFDSDEQADKGSDMDAYYGDVFYLSDDEETRTLDQLSTDIFLPLRA